MKLSVTVNLGNYENIRIDSSEYDTLNACKHDICMALDSFDIPQVADFQARICRTRTS